MLACALSLCVASCGGGSSSSSSGGPPPHASQDQLATYAAHAFLSTYANSDGRVQRTDQGGDTVSEGQAYGMLAAVAVGDRHRFDQIWSWTQHNLQLRNGLFAFHWAGGHVVDPQPASDADLDTARALLVASCRFHEPDLRQAAVRVGKAILAHETAKAGSLQVLMAGPWANKGGYLVFDPSYVDPTTLQDLAKVTGDSRFSAVDAGSTQLVNDLTRPLPPDWAIVNTHTGQPTPVSGASSTSGPGMFTFDAPRTLVRFALDPNPAGRAAAARAWSVFSKTAPQDIVTQHQLSGAAAGSTHSPVTLVAVAGAAKAAGDTSAVPGLLNEAQRL
ncbi:MAG TPA: glycosyl hydrolase family 8, partial [Solirubrobacteraceae bacterium]|nr:glycosyl hydrolase family 8 [Solirubrobacteraceae bacterium]